MRAVEAAGDVDIGRGRLPTSLNLQLAPFDYLLAANKQPPTSSASPFAQQYQQHQEQQASTGDVMPPPPPSFSQQYANSMSEASRYQPMSLDSLFAKPLAPPLPPPPPPPAPVVAPLPPQAHLPPQQQQQKVPRQANSADSVSELPQPVTASPMRLFNFSKLQYESSYRCFPDFPISMHRYFLPTKYIKIDFKSLLMSNNMETRTLETTATIAQTVISTTKTTTTNAASSSSNSTSSNSSVNELKETQMTEITNAPSTSMVKSPSTFALNMDQFNDYTSIFQQQQQQQQQQPQKQQQHQPMQQLRQQQSNPAAMSTNSEIKNAKL